MKPFDQLADDASIQTAKIALEANNISVSLAENSAEANSLFFDLLPEASEVMNMTSQTLIQSGILKQMEDSGKYRLIKEELKKLDPEKDKRLKRQLGAAPDWAVGSVHAITEDGHLLWASQGGSQLPAHSYGAGQVIIVASTKKIVADTAEGLKRIYEYCLPLEEARAQQAYGSGSAVNKILIINKEKREGRIHLILVKENLGF